MNIYNKLGLLLIDSSLDNIHNIVKNLKNNIYYIFIDNYDINIILNKIKQINILNFDFSGLLFFNYELIDFILDDIKKEINLSSFDKIDNNNYNKYFTFEFDYSQQSININYNDTIILEKPNITFLGGIFFIDSIINSEIDKNTGIITINANKIGNYNLLINYTFSNIIFVKIINIISKPIIIYDNFIYNVNYKELLTITKPQIIPFIEGEFFVNTNLINIDKYTGIITNNINIITDTYMIYFKQNNIISNTEIKINVNYCIKYKNDYYEIFYDEKFLSDIPLNYSNIESYYKINNNLFDINTINGEISGKNINIGIYDIIINYGIFSTNIKINVKPIFYYNNSTSLIYSNDGYSELPITKLNILNYYFELNESYSFISIDKFTGKLYFSNNLSVNNYDIIINLKINDIILTSTIYKLIVKPYINYNLKSIFYENLNKLDKPLVFPQNGLFSCDSDIFNIDSNTGIININNLEYESLYGIYKILINYNYNSIDSKTIIEIIIKPKIIYNYNKNINYQSILSLGKPINNYNCTYLLKIYDENVSIDSITGEFKIIKILPINYYNFEIIVNYFHINFIINLDFNIIPIINYNINIIDYNDIMLSDIPNVNPDGGIFTIINNDLNLLISSKGQINFNKCTVGIYNINILYSYNNQSAFFNYNIIIKPVIKYNNLLIDFINPTGGNYYLEHDNFSINEKTGEITILKNIIGIYNLNIKYTVNGISTNYNNIIKIIPNVEYLEYNIIIEYNENYISKIPIIKDIGGIFTINNENITINKLTGQFYINNLFVNTYKFNIIYTLNNVELLLDFILIIKPKIIYNNYSIKYLENFISDKPYTNPENGKFFCLNNNIKIDHIGIIEINNLKVDKYIIPINYYYNNTYTIFNLNLTVYPILNYNYSNNLLLHNINENGNFSLIPYVNPLGGIFKINKIDNNIIIDSNGIINFSNFNLIGKYDIIVDYIYNNISSNFTYKFIKLPKILLKSYYEFEYNTNINILLENNGKYEIDNQNFSINNCNLINNYIIDIGEYNINIKYEYNDCIVYKLIIIIIKPKIKYNNNNIIINNNDIFISDIPIIEPLNGQFTCDNNILINNDGQIIIEPLKYYLINNFIVSYTVNNITTNYNFILSINPYFKYINTNIIITQKITYYSDIPILNRNDGIFSISNNYNNLISIDINGQLCINKELDFGNYEFKVIYTVNDLTYIENFNLIIKLTILYPCSQITVIYSKYYELKPINMDSKLIFNINEINGVTIDSNNGILYINNNNNFVPIGKYLINIYYNNTITNINLIILPELIYDSIVNIINYGNNYKSHEPLINPKYGKFKLITNNDNIIIDDKGIIYGNNLDIGTYNLIIQYTCDNMTQENNYSIICNPILNYQNSILEINYGKGSKSDIPYYFPLNGTFKLKENILGISINTNGIIIFDKNMFIGKYNIEIIYQVYNYIVTTNYNLIIKPNIIYEDSIFIYNYLIITNKPITDFNDGIFKLLNNDNNNITINKKSGILTLINIEPGNYIFNIEYIKNNISIITNYNILIKPNIYYPDNNHIFIYKTNKTIIPILEPSNGIIQINNKNSNNGFINIFNLDIGNYIFYINYTYNSIITNIELNITINSNLYYEFNEYIYNKNNIIYPKNYKNIGKFESNDINVNLDGSINISKLEIGNYSYKINHIVNQIITIIDLNFLIIPEFYYNFTNLNLIYLFNDFYIEKPYISYINNTSYYELEDNNYYLKLNRLTGEIIVDKTLPIGNYILNINYFINNIKTKFTINININPFISYRDTNTFNNDGVIDIKYKDNIYINKPKINPDYGNFEYKLPNGLLFNSDGSIINNDILDVGDYIIEIQYNIDKNKTIEYIRLIVNPEINYINNNAIKIYDTNYESEYPIINSSGEGRFMTSDNIIIDNKTGKLYFDKLIAVNKYNIIINYEINNLNIQTNYNLIVIPLIEITLNTFYLIYNELFIIDPPIVKPEGGIFNLENNYDILSLNDDGSININNLYPGEYNIKLIYIYNNLSNNVVYKIYIKPKIAYNLKNNIIIYNSNTISELPILEPKFNDNSKLILLNITGKIDKYGQILFDSFSVGKYNIKIGYEYNNQIEYTFINFEIIPKFYYNKINYEMNYNTIIYSDIPLIEPKGLKFNTNLNLDENGIITFKNYNIGNHYFSIYYGSSFVNINLIVKPVFYYNQINIVKNYGEQLFIYPINNNPGGIFYCHDNEININSENGFINLDHIYPCDKTIIILYELNSIISQQEITIICYPIIIYTINESIINYNEISHSIIPIIKPIGGKIYSNDLPTNIIINNLGILLFDKPNIGKYKFNIIYEYNSIITETDYKLLVNPIFYYNNDTFYFNQIIKSSLPIINPIKGHIFCDNKNCTITEKGEIMLFNKIKIGDDMIKIYYKINDLITDTLYKFSIIPNVIYDDFKIIYNSDNKIMPKLVDPLGGIFKIQDYNLYIDNNGSFNIYGLEPNEYNINIIYNYNNKDYYYQVKIIIIPELKYIDNKLIYLPLGGILEYDTDIYNINDNNILLNNSQLGNYNLLVNYKYNNINIDLSFNILITTKKIYENTNIDIFYNENIIINPLINYGKYINLSSINNIIINKDGKIILNNIPIGIYDFIIKYENNNFFENINFKINVKPKAIYDDLELQYNNYIISPIFKSSIDGIFNFLILYGNIQYFNDGTIKLLKPKPNNYKIDFNYIVNNSKYNGTFSIKIKPNISLNTNKIIKKYSEEYINNSLLVSPIGGIFSSNCSDILIDYNYLKINEEKPIGNYNIELYYTYNNQISILKIELVIEPQFYYSINTIKLSYYDNIKSVKPFINPYGGIFYINENIDGLIIDELTGIITLKNIITIGNQSILVFYKYNDIISETYYNINLIPILYYNQNLNINYSDNYDLLSEFPFVYPLNGKFSISNYNNIIIDENTGILRFINLSVGIYDIYINYIYNNIKLNTIYKFIVKPNIYFDESLISITYNSYYECKLPLVNPIGGIFTCNNLPTGIYINKTNGKITIYKIGDIIKFGINKFVIKNIVDKGNYTLTINYIIDNIISSTNLFINII